jgi:hypothetical protein
MELFLIEHEDMWFLRGVKQKPELSKRSSDVHVNHHLLEMVMHLCQEPGCLIVMREGDNWYSPRFSRL